MNLEFNYSLKTVNLLLIILSLVVFAWFIDPCLCSISEYSHSINHDLHSIGHDSHHCNHRYPKPHEASIELSLLLNFFTYLLTLYFVYKFHLTIFFGRNFCCLLRLFIGTFYCQTQFDLAVIVICSI